ncbi:MAG: type II secretion system secretin GspD, partial [Gammaproteobacteria bacterium]|nr:type II secretion system secretin GspD [Gammaproteobacteria bacterium]
MFEMCPTRRHNLLIVLLGVLVGGLSGCASSPDARALITDAPEPFPRLESGSGVAAVPPPAPATDLPYPSEASPRGRMTQIYPGSGAFISQPQVIQSGADLEGQEATTLNFESADIREVAAIILGELLKINYVIDPAVQGSITLRTTQALERTTLLSILEVVLEVNGAALIRSAELVRIVPTAKALGGAGTPTVAKSLGAPGYQVQVIPLQYIAAEEMNKILAPLVKKEAMVRVDAKRNLIVVAGAAPELARVNEVVALFDVDWLQGMSFGLFPIRYTDPDTIAAEIQAVFENEEDAFIGKLVNLIPVRRLNVLMVVSSQPRYMSEIQKWIARLDVPGEGEGRRLYVYRVQNGRAEEMAATLRELFDLGGAPPIAPPSALAPGSTPRLVELRPGDQASAGAESPAADVIQRPAAPPASASAAAGSRPAGEASVVDQVNIVADKSRNALLILATPNDYSKIESALLQLDVRPLQVLLEASIVDVNLAGELSHGVQWFFEHRIPPSELTDNRRDFRGEATVGLPLGFPGSLSYSIVNAADEIRALLNLLATEDKLRVVASPSILVLDNETATIRVGDQQPISTSVVTEGGVVATSVQFKDTGVTLTVTPRVNAGGLVTLDISQELTDTGAIDDATGQRSFLQRSVDSRVALQSGESVVLGGLIRENNTRSESGVPFLYKIPVIGFLFGQKVNTVDRTELLVVLNATVVRDGGDMGGIIDEFRERMQGIFPQSDADEPGTSTQPAAPEASIAPPQASKLAPVAEFNSDPLAPASPRQPAAPAIMMSAELSPEISQTVMAAMVEDTAGEESVFTRRETPEGTALQRGADSTRMSSPPLPAGGKGGTGVSARPVTLSAAPGSLTASTSTERIGGP